MPALTTTLARVLEASWQASILVLLVLTLQWLLRKRLSPAWRCAMWVLVLARLAMPVLPESRASLFGLFDRGARPAHLDSNPIQTIAFGIISDRDASPSGAAVALPTSSRISTAAWIAATVWLVGVLLVIGRSFYAIRRFDGKLRQAGRPLIDPAALSCLDECIAQLRVARRPGIVETDLVASPALYGIIRPAILLPAALAERLSRDELRFVLLHELVHLKRHDILLGWLVHLLNAVHWFNPLLWYAAARFRADRELACDAAVLELSGPQHRSDYGRAILRLLDRGDDASQRIALTAAMVEDRRALLRRIRAIAQPVRGRRSMSIFIILLMAALALLTLTRPRLSSALAAQPTDLVTRAYDVRNLLINSPDFAPAPQFKADETGWPVMEAPSTQPAEADRRKLVDQLMTRIVNQIDPTSWKESGGTTGAIAERDGHLLITQTEANHAAVFDFLQTAWANSPGSSQITLECRFLQSEPALAAIGDGRWEEAGGFERLSRSLTEQEFNALQAVSNKDARSTTLIAPRLTLFNGQRAFVVVSTETAYVADLKKIPGRAGALAFDPTIKTARAGIMLDCRATAEPDKKSIKLVLRPHLQQLVRFDTRHIAEGAFQGVAQVPVTRIASIETTETIADGQCQILRTKMKNHPETAKDVPEHPPLLIAIRPRIVRQTVEGIPILPGQPTTRP